MLTYVDKSDLWILASVMHMKLSCTPISSLELAASIPSDEQPFVGAANIVPHGPIVKRFESTCIIRAIRLHAQLFWSFPKSSTDQARKPCSMNPRKKNSSSTSILYLFFFTIINYWDTLVRLETSWQKK